MKIFFILFSVLLEIVPVSVSAQSSLLSQQDSLMSFQNTENLQISFQVDKKVSKELFSLIQKEADSLFLLINNPEELEMLCTFLNLAEKHKTNPLVLGFLHLRISYVQSSEMNILIKNAKTFNDWGFIRLVSWKKEYQDLAERKMLKFAKSFDDFMAIYSNFSDVKNKKFAYNKAKAKAKSFNDFEVLYMNTQIETDKVFFLQKLLQLSKEEENWISIASLPNIDLQKLSNENIK